jgi:DNA-binding NarL/FixJ family response regulator
VKKKTVKVPAKKRILLVDDHPIMRQGLAQLINHEPDLSVCGEAESAKTVMEMIERLDPDLLILDISLPDKNGIEVIKDIQARGWKLPILVVSMHDESLYAERVLRVGGRGYVMKQEGGKKLVDAVRHVLLGKVYVSDSISSKILDVFSAGASKADVSPIDRLSDRELQVFELIGTGKTTREIAHQLHLSIKTVEVHRMNIKRKMGIKTASELIHSAVRWIEPQK